MDGKFRIRNPLLGVLITSSVSLFGMSFAVGVEVEEVSRLNEWLKIFLVEENCVFPSKVGC